MALTFTPVNTISQGQVNDAQNTYNQDTAQSQQVLQNLQNYQKNMQSGTDMYAQNQTAGNQFAGYDPNALKMSQQALRQTQQAIAGLPQAVNAQNAGAGATSAQISNMLSSQGANLNNLQSNQTANVGQNQANQQAALTYAQQATQAGQSGQQLQLQGYQQQYQAAQGQLATAQAQLQSLNQLYQQQGQFNSDEARQYQQLNYMAMEAQASMTTAAAAMEQANKALNYSGLDLSSLQQPAKAAAKPALVAPRPQSSPTPSLGQFNSAIGNTISGALSRIPSGVGSFATHALLPVLGGFLP
jgi:hypothetical protein